MDERMLMIKHMEETRARLDYAIGQNMNIADGYEESLEFDRLMEQYITLYQEPILLEH